MDPPAWAEFRKSEDGARAYWRFAEVALRWPKRFQLPGTSAEVAVALWSDQTHSEELTEHEDNDAAGLLRWTKEFMPSGTAAAILRPSRSSSGWGFASSLNGISDIKIESLQGVWGSAGDIHKQLSGAAKANILLLDMLCSGDEAIRSLRCLLLTCLSSESNSGLVAETGTAILRLRCGRRAKAVKKWLRDTSKQLESEIGAQKVELLHLLGDKDTERTAVFNWAGTPPPETALKPPPQDVADNGDAGIDS